MAEKLTDRTIFSGTVDKDNDLIHLVDVSDTSQDPAGSSFSCVPKKFINSYISSGSETEGQTLYYDATTGKFLNTSNVHIDDSNNFVGVGITSALTAKLHVKSASGTSFQVDGSATTSNLHVTDIGQVGIGGSTFTGFPFGIAASNVKLKVFGTGYASIYPSTFFASDNAYIAVGGSIGQSVSFYALSKAYYGTLLNHDTMIGRNETRIISLVSGNYNVSLINTSALADGSHDNSQMSFWVDEVGDTLNFKVKYSSGTVKSGTVALV